MNALLPCMQRWCCGDMDHFDVSVWAFEKLTDKKWGVIGIKYRRVPCEHKPENQAPAISNPSPWPSQADWGAHHRAELILLSLSQAATNCC
jgi:hypothetical protein